MVPWHLQPKYTNSGKATAGKGAREQEKGRGRRRRREREGRSQPGPVEGDAIMDKDMGNATAVQSEGGQEGGVQSEGGQEGGVQSEGGQEGGVQSEGGQEGGVQSEGGREGGEETRISDLGYTTYQRYYHVFRQGELVDLVHRTPGLSVEQDFYDHENWCVLAVKNSCF